MVVAVMLATCAWLAGCASLLGNAQRPVSHALADPGATPLEQLPARERIRDSGLESLRLRLARVAKHGVRRAAGQVRQMIAADAWKVELTPDSRLLWQAPAASGAPNAHHEPDTSVWLRLLAVLLAPLAPDELL